MAAVLSQHSRKFSPQLFDRSRNRECENLGSPAGASACNIHGGLNSSARLLQPVVFLVPYVSFFFPEILLFLFSSSFYTYLLQLSRFDVLAPNHLLFYFLPLLSNLHSSHALAHFTSLQFGSSHSLLHRFSSKGNESTRKTTHNKFQHFEKWCH